MNKKLKKGITMTSLVMYVVIFSTITVVLSMIYTNMNEALFTNRGGAINYTMLNKLQYNITGSALNSNDVLVEDNNISYSNGDFYEYNEEKDILLLNGGILCTNVTEFTPILTSNDEVKKIEISVTFNKYLNELNKKIISSLEVN